MKIASAANTTAKKVRTSKPYTNAAIKIVKTKAKIGEHTEYNKAATLTTPKPNNYKVLITHKYSMYTKPKGGKPVGRHTELTRSGKNLAYSYERYEGRRTTPSLQKKGNVNLQHAAIGGAVAYGGYKAYQHRDQIKEKAHTVGMQAHNAFHSTRSMLGAH